jgi:hypothetical protein
MAELVPADQIEAIVGVDRHPTDHYARAVSAEQTVYILHPRSCLDLGIDLRDCPYSLALDRGINVEQWIEDAPVIVTIRGRRLVPATI